VGRGDRSAPAAQAWCSGLALALDDEAVPDDNGAVPAHQVTMPVHDLAQLVDDDAAPEVVPLVPDVLGNLAFRIAHVAGRRARAILLAGSSGRVPHRLDGVLADLARRVGEGRPVPLAMGHFNALKRYGGSDPSMWRFSLVYIHSTDVKQSMNLMLAETVDAVTYGPAQLHTALTMLRKAEFRVLLEDVRERFHPNKNIMHEEVPIT